MFIPHDIFALDLGTTKFCIAAVLRQKGKGLAVHTVTVPAGGMRRGMLANFEEAEVSLSSLLESAERQLGRDIRRVVIGVAGSHLRGQNIFAKVPLSRGEVDAETLKVLQTSAEQLVANSQREILHAIPLHYRVDTREQTTQPLHFTGQVISGNYFVIDADRAYLRDVVRLANRCGLEVGRLAAEPLASSTVTLRPYHKENGVAVLDIGGGTSDGLVFLGGKPAGLFTLNIAGAMMSKDIAIGLDCPIAEAERAKLHFGLMPGPALEITNHQDEPRTITATDLQKILGPRLLELAELIADALQPFKGTLGSGLVITGGGAEIKGIEPFLRQQFKIPVESRTAELSPESLPMSVGLKSTTRLGSPYATALGLLNLELGRLNEAEHLKRYGGTRSYLGQFMNWLKELSE